MAAGFGQGTAATKRCGRSGSHGLGKYPNQSALVEPGKKSRSGKLHCANTGVGHWLDQRRDLAAARARIAQLEARIAAREDEARALRDDPLAQEAAIRKDLGLARPGAWVVREEGLTNLRNP